MTDVDLRGPVEQTLSVLTPKAQRVSVSLAASLPAGPVLVQADADHMRQLVLNLVLNAIDAIAENGRVEVSVAVDEIDDAWCRLQVADSGPGLPVDSEGRLFEPFYSTKDSGLGMGLPICRQIVEGHHGEISAMNRPEGGALFTVRLPAAKGMRRTAPTARRMDAIELDEVLKS
jgi:signal transduction histidine kinase